MNILPTKYEFNTLRSASEKIETLCEGTCLTCFIKEHIAGESCCPVPFINSITQEITDELMQKVLESLPEKEEEEK